jgi:hypothetical protein
MTEPAEPRRGPLPKRRRRTLVVTLTAVILAGVLLGLIFIPYSSVAQEIQDASVNPATTVLTIPHAGWVTVQFRHPSRMGMSMHHWMQGAGGMMFDHAMMGGSDSYSFWSWGGTYQCGAGYAGTGYGTIPVWVNATWGVL